MILAKPSMAPIISIAEDSASGIVLMAVDYRISTMYKTDHRLRIRARSHLRSKADRSLPSLFNGQHISAVQRWCCPLGLPPVPRALRQ